MPGTEDKTYDVTSGYRILEPVVGHLGSYRNSLTAAMERINFTQLTGPSSLIFFLDCKYEKKEADVWGDPWL